MEINKAEQHPLLPSCRDLIREVDELQKQGVYDAPQSPPMMLSPLKQNQPLREPLGSISNTEDQIDSKIIYGHALNTTSLKVSSGHAIPPISHSGTYFNASNASDASFAIHTNVSFDLGATSLVIDNTSSDWYNDSRSSISSPLSASFSSSPDNSKAQEDQSVKCGEACLRAAQKALMERYSSCSFTAFGSRSPVSTAPPLSRQFSSSSSASSSVLSSAPKLVGSVYTAAPHNPASGKRHFCLEIRDPVVAFHMPSACTSTKGIAVTDILTFEGQCIVDPGASVVSELTNGDLQRTSIDLVIEWKGHSREVVSIPVRCGCGHEIKKGQIALEIARAHSRYFATQRCEETYRKSTDIITSVEDLRLMALYTRDNGATWRAQHVVVESFTYESMEYQTQDGERRSGTVAYSGRGPSKKFMAWVRDRVEV